MDSTLGASKWCLRFPAEQLGKSSVIGQAQRAEGKTLTGFSHADMLPDKTKVHKNALVPGTGILRVRRARTLLRLLSEDFFQKSHGLPHCRSRGRRLGERV
jgi:hypothetical protein